MPTDVDVESEPKIVGSRGEAEESHAMEKDITGNSGRTCSMTDTDDASERNAVQEVAGDVDETNASTSVYNLTDDMTDIGGVAGAAIFPWMEEINCITIRAFSATPAVYSNTEIMIGFPCETSKYWNDIRAFEVTEWSNVVKLQMFDLSTIPRSYKRKCNNMLGLMHIHQREESDNQQYQFYTPTGASAGLDHEQLRHMIKERLNKLKGSRHKSRGRFARGEHDMNTPSNYVCFTIYTDHQTISEPALVYSDNSGEVPLQAPPETRDYLWRLNSLTVLRHFHQNLRPTPSEVASAGFYFDTTALVCYVCNKRHRLEDFAEMQLHPDLLHEHHCWKKNYKLCRFCSRGTEESAGAGDEEKCVRCGRLLQRRTIETGAAAQEVPPVPDPQQLAEAKAFVEMQCCLEGCRNIIGPNERVEEICRVCHGQACDECSRNGRRHIHYIETGRVTY